MTINYSALQEEAHHLACQLFEDKAEMVSSFTNRLLDICDRAQGKDFLLVYNPGGWGSRALEHCLQWEKNIVAGVSATLERLGYTPLMVQHFRSGTSWQERIRDVREQFRFFASKARIMAAEVEFITQHVDNLRVILIGASQGAAFVNAVMQQLARLHQVYSIELGMFFPHLSRRVIGERTLSLDWNGIVPDAAVRRDMIVGLRAYMAAPFKWLWYRLKGKPVKFVNCVDVRGHNYDWGYPYVQRRIVGFLEINCGTESGEEEVRGLL
jgi:pimeloyl-ACP methyl ester carboxylesterase